MNRDMDTVRSVLAEVEALTPQQCNDKEYLLRLDLPEDEYLRVWHLLMLQDEKCIKGIRADSARGQCLISPELTWKGAELADFVRERPFY